MNEAFTVKMNFNKRTNVIDLSNKAFVTDEAKMNKEKLKGKFVLKINHDLQMTKKIEMYANDNVAFFLHKNRNFITKLVKG